LQIPVSGSLFVKAGADAEEWLVFCMEVFRKRVQGSEDALGTLPVRFNRVLLPRELEALSRLSTDALYASCLELRPFEDAYGALLAEIARKALRGTRPQPLHRVRGAP
jgi:hypothetical protein